MDWCPLQHSSCDDSRVARNPLDLWHLLETFLVALCAQLAENPSGHRYLCLFIHIPVSTLL